MQGGRDRRRRRQWAAGVAWIIGLLMCVVGSGCGDAAAAPVAPVAPAAPEATSARAEATVLGDGTRGAAGAAATSAPAGAPAPNAPPAALPAVITWPPPAWAQIFAAEPKTELDGQIRTLVRDYAARIGRLELGSPLMQSNLPRLLDKLEPLAREYNRDKGRYASDHFSAAECLQRATEDLKRWIDEGVEKGVDPARASAGRWTGPVCWIDGTEVLGQYDLVVPVDYDPARSYPLMVCFQDSPDIQATRKAGFFLIRAIQKGYPKGFVGVEKKVQALVKDVAGKYNIDPLRIYGTGFSFGGHTALTLAIRYPHLFAAIVPVCNDLRDNTAPYVKYLTATPTRLLHGNRDSFLETGKRIYGWMKEAGCPVEWGTYEGGHDPGVPFNKQVGLLTDFMNAHVLDPYPKRVTKIVEHKRYSRAFWVDAILTRDAADQQACFEVEVIQPDRIEVTADEGIAGLELHLNAKLVDLTRPLVVMSGKSKLFEGMVGDGGVVRVRLQDGEKYTRVETTPLWEQLQALRAARGFADNPVARPAAKTE